MLISAFVNLRVCDSECLSVPPGFVNLRGKQFIFQQFFHFAQNFHLFHFNDLTIT